MNEEIINLLSVMKRGDYNSQKIAEEKLSKIKNPQIVPILIDVIKKDDDRFFRMRLAGVLGKMDPWVLPSIFKAMETDDKELRIALGSIFMLYDNKDAVPILLEALKHKDFYIRICAAEALEKSGDKTIIPDMIEAIKDENHNVRYHAIAAIGNFGAKEHIPILIEAMKTDEYNEARGRAAKSLAQIGDISALPAVIEALKDKDEMTRDYVSDALEEFDFEASRDVLVKVLDEEKDAEVRKYIINVLGEIGEPSIVGDLIKSLEDKSPKVRYETIEAIKEIGKDASTAVPSLLKLLKNDSDTKVRAKAASTIGEFTNIDAIPILNDAMKNDKEPLVQVNAACALGRLDKKEKAVMPFLINSLKKQKDPEVIAAAFLAICYFPKQATPAVPLSIKALQDKNRDVRKYAAMSLRFIGKGAFPAVPALIKAMKEKDFGVRNEVIGALKTIQAHSPPPHINQQINRAMQEAMRDLMNRVNNFD